MAEPKATVTITYRKPGTQPPLYVAGSFSGWLPQEMDYTTEENGEHFFEKKVAIEPYTRIQYKFRVGEGDWWVLDEQAPTATDGLGNTNNILEAPPTQDAPAEKSQPAVSKTEDHSPSHDHDASNAPKAKETSQQPKEVAQSALETEEKAHDVIQPQKEVTEQKEIGESQRTEQKVVPKAGSQDESKLWTDPAKPSIPEEEAQPPEKPDTDKKSDAVEDAEEGPSQKVSSEVPRLWQPKTAVGNFKESIARSETSTPVFVKTAAEVADSAALLDKEPPEEEVPDKEAGQIGFRRLSSTPIPQVAKTAAEVADSAKLLDVEEPEANIVVSPVAYHSLADFRDDMKDDSLDLPAETAGGVPLFAHECIGLYEDDEIPGKNGVESNEDHQESRLVDEENDVDPDDPTLEKFPSNRDEIMDTVLKMETGLNVDETHFEGVPPSPVVGPSKNGIVDMSGEAALSPQTSPVRARAPKRLDVPKKAPRTSLSSERSLSVLSLGSIAEQEERDAEKTVAEEIAPIVTLASTADEVINVAKDAEGEVILPSEHPAAVEEIIPVVEQASTAEEIIGAAKEAEGDLPLPSNADSGAATVVPAPSLSIQAPSAPKPPASDEDEAVDVKEAQPGGYLTPERAASPQPREHGSLAEPTPNTASPIESLDTKDHKLVEALAEAATLTVVPDNASRSPKIVVHAAETDDADGSSELPTAAVDLGEGGNDPVSVEEEPELDTTEVLEVTELTPTGIETTTITSTHLTRRGVQSPTERTSTPASISGAGREAASSGNWIQTFFRMIFVDWIGGFLQRLFSGGRKELLLTTGTAAVIAATGVAWWRGLFSGYND